MKKLLIKLGFGFDFPLNFKTIDRWYFFPDRTLGCIDLSKRTYWAGYIPVCPMERFDVSLL